MSVQRNVEFLEQTCYLKVQQYVTLYQPPELTDHINNHFMLTIQMPTRIRISNLLLCLMDQFKSSLRKHIQVRAYVVIHTPYDATILKSIIRFAYTGDCVYVHRIPYKLHTFEKRHLILYANSCLFIFFLWGILLGVEEML